MTDTPIVIALQECAIDVSLEVTTLLRKALAVATKLELSEFREWLLHELEGYGATTVPEYRKLRAELKVESPYRGLIPFVIPDDSLMDAICNVELRDPLGGILDLITAPSDKGHIEVPLPPELQAMLIQLEPSPLPMRPVRVLARNHLAGVLDAVRTAVLKWALQLEAEGIIGTAFSFSKEERERVGVVNHILIENFQGILGDVNHSTVHQSPRLTINKGDLDSLRRFLSALGVADRDVEQLASALQEEPTPSDGRLGKKVGSWVGRMVTKAATGVWSAAVSTAGNVLSAAIKAYYGM